MSRLLFFLLLVANIAFGAHLWLSAQPGERDFSRRERNGDEVKIVAVIPPLVAARQAEQERKQVQSLAGAACVEFTGIAAASLPQAREALAAMQLGDRLAERRVEEITRHWVYVPAARDRRTAEQSAATLRGRGVTEISIRPDFAISLGVFSTEEAARRFLAQVEAKGAKGVTIGPFSKEVRDSVFLVREPDTDLLARLALLQREHPASTLRAVACPAANGAAAAPAAPAKP
ncbi:MAG: SPOR domain-containing protein [Burkholderiales bacterium]|nr:SPOR domain-containing protein [Burkholderiales bacterium]